LGTREARKTGGGSSGGEPVELPSLSHFSPDFSLPVHFPFTASYFPRAIDVTLTILFRYLAREIFWATMLLLIALMALFALFDLIRELGDLGKGTYSLAMVLAYVTLSQPAHVVVIFPLAALMGTLFAISRLSTQSELAVMRTSGLSLTRLSIFAMIIGLAFSAVTYAFGEYVAPLADETAKRLRVTATSKVTGREFRTGFWVVDGRADGRAFVNIETVTPETELLNMRIFDFDTRYQLRSINIVKSAVYDASQHWVLTGVEKTIFEGQNARVEKLPTAQWNSSLTPDVLSALRVKPDQMSISKLSTYIDHLRDNKRNSTRYELAYWDKVFQPVAVIIMMLLAIPFAIQSNRAGGVGARMLAGVMIGLGFYFLSRLSGHLTALNDWPPFMAAAGPLVLFCVFAVALIGWKEYAVRWPRGEPAVA
jgi:lipopolysaccharide export system permease protein